MFKGLSFKALTSFNLIFLALMGILVIAVGLAPTVNKFGLYQQALIIFAAASVIASTFMMVTSYGSEREKSSRIYNIATVVAFSSILMIQIYVAISLTSYGYTWDSERIFNEASLYATSGSFSNEFDIYLKSNPNNIALITGLGLFFKGLASLGVTNFLLSITLLNVFVLFLTQIITFTVAKMLYGRRVAAISLVFSFILIGLSMHVQTPYTDTLAIFFPVTILWLALLLIRSKRLVMKLLFSGAIGAMVVIGTLIKPTVVIALAAVMIAGVIYFFTLKDRSKRIWYAKVFAISLAGFAIIGVATYLAFVRLVDSSNILPYSYSQANDNGKPITHFIAMGLRSTISGNSHNYGGYDKELTDTITYLQTPEAKLNYSLHAIQTQLGEYSPFTYLVFLANKIKWVMSDATFFAYGEGDLRNISFYDNSPASNTIRQFMYVEGKHYQLFGAVLQAFWVAILLLIAMQLYFVIMHKRSRYNLYTFILRLMIAGILVFLIIFEARARYILLYTPVFILLAMYTLRWFKEAPATQEDAQKL